MNNDLISREALKEDLAKEIKTNDMGVWLKILLVIDNATPVDLWHIRREATENALKKAEEIYKRPKGKWIGDCYNPECDQCHTKPLEVFCDSLGLDGGSYVSIPMTFCPSCGADMRGGAE